MFLIFKTKIQKEKKLLLKINDTPLFITPEIFTKPLFLIYKIKKRSFNKAKSITNITYTSRLLPFFHRKEFQRKFFWHSVTNIFYTPLSLSLNQIFHFLKKKQKEIKKK